MKPIQSVRLITALICCAAITSFATASEGPTPAIPAAAAKPSFLKAEEAGVSAEWLATVKTEYPLDFCMVSDDNLESNDMGPPQDWVYREVDRPDRLVRLCCNHCVKDFKKGPAKYLKMIDDALAEKAHQSPSK